MSFLKKIKQAIGVNTLKVELRLPGHVAHDSGKLQGEFVVSAEAAQKINRTTIKLVQEYSKGSDEDKQTKKYELGKLEDHTPLALTAGETKTIPFTLPFKMQMSSNQANARKGGVTGAFGKLLSAVQSENVKHEVIVSLDVAGAAFDASDRKPVYID